MKRIQSMFVRKIDGLPVRDAKSKVVVTVTAKDIAKASRKHPGACVMAQAGMRELHAAQVRVHLSRIYVLPRGGKNWLRYEADSQLRDEIVAYDRGGHFQPGDYLLPPPGSGHREGDRGGGGPKDRNRKRSRRSPIMTTNVRVRAGEKGSGETF
jgi:hypothetical protein